MFFVLAVSLIYGNRKFAKLIDKLTHLRIENIMRKQARKQAREQVREQARRRARKRAREQARMQTRKQVRARIKSNRKKQDKSILVLQTARVIMALAFFVLLVLIGYHLYEYRKGDRIYSQIREKTITDKTETASVEETAVENGGEIDFEALRNLNSDCVAWIYGCDGEIDYPVVLSKDDAYYLTHTISGEVNKAGSIFVDQYAEEPFREFQTILYGHNMKNGSMFHALMNYRNPEYWENHRTVTIYLEGEKKEYRIFAAYYSYYSELPIYDNMETQEERAAYLARIKALSRYDTEVEVSAEDKLLTLVTCEYSGEDYRMVVHAVEITETD